MPPIKIFLQCAVALALLSATSGCITLGVAAATETGVVAAQERTMGNAVDDATILAKLKQKYIASDSQDLFFGVEVKVVEGRVLLTGTVDKPDSQINAVRLAWQVDGVKEVIDEIHVNDKTGFADYARDVWISTQVRSRLLFAKNIRSVNYSVITVNQVVYIMGIAQDQDELSRVHYLASTTSYVKQVVSHARLKTDPRRNQPL